MRGTKYLAHNRPVCPTNNPCFKQVLVEGSLLDLRIAGKLFSEARELKKSYSRFFCTEKLLRNKLVGEVKEQKVISGKRLWYQAVSMECSSHIGSP